MRHECFDWTGHPWTFCGIGFRLQANHVLSGEQVDVLKSIELRLKHGTLVERLRISLAGFQSSVVFLLVPGQSALPVEEKKLIPGWRISGYSRNDLRRHRNAMFSTASLRGFGLVTLA